MTHKNDFLDSIDAEGLGEGKDALGTCHNIQRSAPQLPAWLSSLSEKNIYAK